MSERFDAELHERLERLATAVPDLDGVHGALPTLSRPDRATWRVPGASQVSAPWIALAVFVIAGVGLFGVRGTGAPGGTGTDAPVSATTSDGPFTLTVRAEHGRYTPTDEIRIDASLVYTGPDPEITISHGYGTPLGFGIVEPVLGLELGPSWLLSCERSIVKRDVPITRPFGKSGGFDGSDPQAAEKRRFLTDPILRLPTGTWHVYAVAWFGIGDCGVDEHHIRAEITIVVEESGVPSDQVPTDVATETPAPAATPVPTRPPSGVALPYPEGCVVYGLSERRCAFIVDEARLQLPPGSGDVEKVELLGDPDCPENTSTCYVVRTMAFVVLIRLTTAGGVENDYPIFCGVGGQYSYACTETPEIGVPSLGNSGYWDTPCSGEAPVGCASPLPSIDPGAAADAVPLEIGALDIPIDHAGDFRIPLGTATIPNGQLSEASLRIAGTSAWFLVEGGLRLNVTSLDPSRPPFENVHIHGWYPGVEEVSVALEFTILQADAGAVLSIADVVVR